MIYCVQTLEGAKQTDTPGQFAGHRSLKIFGRLDCWSGKKMFHENRVFFATLRDAVLLGYRPCRNCRPLEEQDFEQIRALVTEESLNEFYHRP